MWARSWVLEFIRVRLVQSCAHCGSLRAFRVVWLNGACPGGRWVNSGPLVHSGVPWGSLG